MYPHIKSQLILHYIMLAFCLILYNCNGSSIKDSVNGFTRDTTLNFARKGSEVDNDTILAGLERIEIFNSKTRFIVIGKRK